MLFLLFDYSECTTVQRPLTEREVITKDPACFISLHNWKNIMPTMTAEKTIREMNMMRITPQIF